MWYAPTLASTQEYDPWGKVRAGGVGQTSINYTGQRLDDTGLLFYNARYYDPAIGRFVSADTIGPELRMPQTLNRYSYVLNNPLKYTDPTGHCAEGDGDDPDACRRAQDTLGSYAVQLEGLEFWKLHELELVIQGLDKMMQVAGWSVADFKYAMNGIVTLIRGGNQGRWTGYQQGWTVTLYDAAFTTGAEAIHTTIHEFAHQWDAASQGQLSTGLVYETGGRQRGVCVDTFLGYGGCVGTYIPGEAERVPNRDPHFRENKYEDFAESVDATVDSSSPGNNTEYAGSKRDLYVQSQFKIYSQYAD